MPMNQETREKILAALSSPFGEIELQCDQLRVVYQVRGGSNLKFSIMPFVGGEFRGAWFLPELKLPESRLLRLRRSRVWTKAQAAKLKRAGVKDADKVFESRATFDNPRQLVRHLAAEFDSVEIVERQA